MMTIKKIELFHIEIPLNFTFKTSQATIKNRETIIIKITDKDNIVGYGEVVAFNEPFYTNETLVDSKIVLVNKFIPRLINNNIRHPFDIHKMFDITYPMALAGIENALLDLYAKQQRKSILDIVFKEEKNATIYAGVTFGDEDIDSILIKIKEHLHEGYIRFKIKIKPKDAYIKLKAIREKYPHIQLFVDANRSYSIKQINEIKKLDQFDLLCIEEPLDFENLIYYQKLQELIHTPICLDESISSIEDFQKAIQLKAFKVINIKVGRLGGLYYTKEIIDLCRIHNIKFWIGSMVESGISKILHVHLASLKDTYIPGDLSASKRYFQNDIITPEIIVNNGVIEVPRGYGLGVDINYKALNQYTLDHIILGNE